MILEHFFFFLNTGHPLVELSDEIERLTIHRGLEKNVHKLTLGTPEQLRKATRLMKHCQQKGHWLLLENCQAVKMWDDHFLNELRVSFIEILNSR